VVAVDLRGTAAARQNRPPATTADGGPGGHGRAHPGACHSFGDSGFGHADGGPGLCGTTGAAAFPGWCAAIGLRISSPNPAALAGRSNNPDPGVIKARALLPSC